MDLMGSIQMHQQVLKLWIVLYISFYLEYSITTLADNNWLEIDQLS